MLEGALLVALLRRSHFYEVTEDMLCAILGHCVGSYSSALSICRHGSYSCSHALMCGCCQHARHAIVLPGSLLVYQIEEC